MSGLEGKADFPFAWPSESVNPSKFGSSIDLSQGILLVHPHRQGMTASDEKPNQDKEAAKA
jgi:hypothetical protein